MENPKTLCLMGTLPTDTIVSSVEESREPDGSIRFIESGVKVLRDGLYIQPQQRPTPDKGRSNPTY
jgi:hypothetical protein